MPESNSNFKAQEVLMHAQSKSKPILTNLVLIIVTIALIFHYVLLKFIPKEKFLEASLVLGTLFFLLFFFILNIIRIQHKPYMDISEGVYYLAHKDLIYEPFLDPDPKSPVRVAQEHLKELVENYRSLVSITRLVANKISRDVTEFSNMSDELDISKNRIQQVSFDINNVTFKENDVIRFAVDSLNIIMTSFDEVMQQTTLTIDTISTIAKQTNLMAINATIEANKAGAYGRGFRVVAENIQRLSDDTERYVRQMSSDMTRLKKVLQDELTRLTNSLESIAENVETLNKVNSIIDTESRTLDTVARKAKEINESLIRLTSGLKQELQPYNLLEDQLKHRSVNLLQ